MKRRLMRSRRPQIRRTPWWLLTLLGIVSFGTVGLATAVGTVFAVYYSYARDYAPIEERILQRYVGLTEVYDRGGPRDGVLLGALANPNAALLRPIPLNEVSPFMVEATISTEDNSFWSNPGVNPGGLLRAAWENYNGGGFGTGSGGSSLTQQLVKNVYLSDDCSVIDGTKVCVAPRTLKRKLKELTLAIELEKDYSKQQILGWYFNQVSYADRYVGVEAAAQGYFRKPAAGLTLGEAALLAGIPSAPTQYHPRLNCLKDDDGNCIVDAQGRTTVAGEAKRRQEHVLDLMVVHGRVTFADAEAAAAQELRVYPAVSSLRAAAWIDNQVEPRLVRMCKAGILPTLEGTANCVESVHSSGYRVTSTLDYAETERARALAQEYIAAGLEAGCQCHNAAIVTIDPRTGQIMVYVTSIDPKNVTDRKVAGEIDQLTEVNQPGSSFKPAVYLAWFDALGKTPMSSIWDTSPMPLITKPAKPEDQVTIVNPRPGFGGEGLITARAALGGSQNVGAFRAADEAGIDNVIAMAKALGITTLDLGFDPTFRSHEAIYYGSAIATGGANIRAIDMAYMNTIIANMGVQVGVATLARTLEDGQLLSLEGATGDAYDRALQQKLDFNRGHLRLPGTREVDPVTILRVEGINGEVLYEHGKDLQRREAINPGSVWMLHSIMSDCTARFIIWGCGGNNNDLALDFFVGEVRIPGGIKTGTQQGFTDAKDTLETWMNGYSRYAGTAVWVGNADNSLVRDGPAANYASANTTVRLFKNWMGLHHASLKEKGDFETPANFDELRPKNVKLAKFQSATTERGRRGGCSQIVESWQRTDIKYTGDCVNGRMPLPTLKPDLAAALARARGIPFSGKVGTQTVSSTEPGPSATAAPSSTPTTGPTATAPAPPRPTATAPAPPRPTATAPAPPPPTPVPSQLPKPKPTPTPSGGG
ncbi:MAG: transglycosylase domain-containing protein [Tepidiformaceae bacterium]